LRDRLEATYQTALAALLRERHPEGYWVGELSTSALSTATAVMALYLVQKHGGQRPCEALVEGGLAWLAAHQNADGGWGDTDKSISNISTTMLCRSAFYLTQRNQQYSETIRRGEGWLFSCFGNTPEQLAEAVRNRYGKDRTFAVPILTTCALAGLVSWQEVPPLPFELACFPQSWFRFLRLHVVSYALPALIAIGQAVHQHRSSWNPITNFIRWLARKPSLKVLQIIQPSSGGFLEATPLTSFVTLSLASIDLAHHPVTQKAVEFLVNSVKPDGSWPIDTNLATWVTTLSINALAETGDLASLGQLDGVRDWLLRQQYRDRHPYTGADAGAWAWTPLPGGVPDGDDTPGALLALAYCQLDFLEKEFVSHDVRGDHFFLPVVHGLQWLLNLQNADGGWPTFCRGWGHLPFDRSGADLTAHALRACAVWGKDQLGPLFQRICRGEPFTFARWPSKALQKANFYNRLQKAIPRSLQYLQKQQRPDGSWLPLWFGNQHAPGDENPTYGTARVLAGYRDLELMDSEPARRGVAWLLGAQNLDGGWGGRPGTPSTMEETALAVEILLDVKLEARPAIHKGLDWLMDRVEKGGLDDPSPIGFYFAKLWYYEKLYPIIFTVAALGKANRYFRARL
jgi:squalene-hopene/tetraprenyl-beta-curcumene cyclase